MNTIKQTVQKGYAKINLHLDITGIMDGGYHSVNNIMQSVSLCDTVTLTERADGEFFVVCNADGVPTGKDNLAVKAAVAFCESAGVSKGADIYIDKRIPMAAGLAGGSADAAAVLRGMNALCGSPLTLPRLCEIGSRLGADVPFCIMGGSAFADGKGDILHPFPAMPDCALVIACGGEGVSTPMAYGMLDRLHNNFGKDSVYIPRDTEALRGFCESGDIGGVARSMYNIFESPILSVRPVAAKLREVMLECGAIGAMMSGSGPSVFGIFPDDTSASRAAEAIRAMGVEPHICRPNAKM
ncbi:MAG: 4-(cytidine 5'-diphospho)-2-C-methyl-D-erythritol kinase [Clostridia bacterium]|nr:4-(cytidine 5'-diphospho)-2-C-methyl-D-erythritol kinase [Clostridia bacterium]